MNELISFLLSSMAGWGYWGIFIMMAIESTILPLPSELVMIPAGYLAFNGEMDVFGAIASGTLGSMAGAIVNYYLAKIVGRKFIQKYGKYLFMPPEKLARVERFFNAYGSFSTFSGRLIPVVRHLISIVAGLALVEMRKFVLYTGIGAGIWVTILTALGYFIGHNEQLIHESLTLITCILLVLTALGSVIYRRRVVRKLQ